MGAVAWWAVAGAAVVGFVGSWWWSRLRQPPSEKAERAVIRALWRLTKRVPDQQLLRDPHRPGATSVSRGPAASWRSSSARSTSPTRTPTTSPTPW